MTRKEIYDNLMFANFQVEEVNPVIKDLMERNTSIEGQVKYIVEECDLFEEEGERNLTQISWNIYNELTYEASCH